MTSQSRNWTYSGLAIALFGIPAITGLFNALGVPRSDGAIAMREVAILAMTAVLLWIVVRKERLPLSSIGLKRDRPGRTILLGIVATVVIFAAIIAMLAIYGALGVSYGEGQPIAPSMGVTLLTVARAGLSEELFYRGFAFERIEWLSGNKWIAAAIVILGFGLFHYSQGLAGIMLALVLGAILTGFYMWKRNLAATIIAHFLVDFIPNVALPLAGAAG